MLIHPSMGNRTAVIDETDLPAVDEFLRRTFYKDEPLISTNSVQFWENGLHFRLVSAGISVKAVDWETNDIIGVAVNDPQSLERRIYNALPEDQKFQEMFEHIEDASDVLGVAPEAVEIRFLATDAAWRGCGVARALIEASEAVARQAGFRWAKIYCTSAYTDCLMRKLGWSKLYSLSYKAYVAEYNSDMKIPPDPHTHCHLYVCDLTAGVS